MATYNILGEFMEINENETSICHQYSRIRKIENLEKCKNLKTLMLISNCIEKIENLEKNLNLEHLELYENTTKLKVLDLSFNKIKVIENLDTLINLEELYLSSNKISKIENLGNCKKLRLLELGCNKIRKIENIENLENLEELWLGKNKISNMDLPKLPKLKKISLQNNRLVEWCNESINNILHIEELYISHNKISIIPNCVNVLKEIKILDVAYNNIENILICSQLKSLEELWINNNKINDKKMIENLINNKNLRTLYLEKNPIEQNLNEQYRNIIINILPQLTQLDALPIIPFKISKKTDENK